MKNVTIYALHQILNCIHFVFKYRKERDHLRELGVVGPPTWEDNINLEFKEIVCEYVDWIQLAEDKVRRRILEPAEMKESRGSHGVTTKITAL
jgi:hypothetical protein